MKKIIFSVFLFPASLFCAQHVGMHLGTDYTFRTDIPKTGQKIGFSIGGTYAYDLSADFKGELELTYREGHKRTEYVDAKEDVLAFKKFASKHSWSYMVNGIYSPSSLSILNVNPYLGCGIGYCANTEHYKIKKADLSNEEKRHDKCFAWQLLLGATYPVAQNYALNARYCYNAGQSHYKSHSVSCGLERVF